ncbi:RNA polymerase II subunit A C-terminal domain phosphatase [Prorops nasuta]|uniref:RNA polymerase II subunit A C-terminal domain phosphatase n=1 Tax=Prorops nasuta TaxID=863751 RepID=UPI0034CD4D60
MATIKVTFPPGGKPGKILKWKVSLNTMVSAGKVLLLYNNVPPGNEDTKDSEKKLKATHVGRVSELLVKQGDIVQPGQEILILEGCKHPAVIKDLCAECGADLRLEADNSNRDITTVSQASVPMVHSIPELKVCPELAIKIGKEDEQRLLKDKKLALLVDLDQTIVHTTNDNVPPDMKDVYHYQLYGPHSPWYHTRLRPNTRHFLLEMSLLYELHICTFGARNYAHTVAALLDKDGTLFSHRILSRDECFDPASKTANLKALFPCGDDMVCIIDDREDVWQGCGNLVQVKPYHFFRHTGDIHAPPGLDKLEPPESKETIEAMEADEKDRSENQTENGMKVTLDNKEKEIPADSTSIAKIEESGCIKKEDEVIKSDETESKESKSEQNKSGENKSKEYNPEDNKPEEYNPEEKTTKESECNVPKGDVILDEDADDYLLYLEDILKRIHAEYYSKEPKENRKKSLREIIPRTRARVLKGLRLTFSGLIATVEKLHESRAYKVARAFGAEVTQDITEETTHLVANRPGTAKTILAKKNAKIKIVNPDWLWTCAERWEHVDERLFPLTVKARGSRAPPPHCSSSERTETELDQEKEDSFADSINPLMSFSSEEIRNMDKEVEEDMEDVDQPVFDSEEIDDSEKNYKRDRGDKDSGSESDSNDYNKYISKKKQKFSFKNSEDEYNFGSMWHDNTNDSDSTYLRKGVNHKKEHSKDNDDDNDNDDDDDNDNDNDVEEDEDDPITRFRRGEVLTDDADLGNESPDSVENYDGMENEDDREWNAMGAALEREFLSD